MSFRLESYRPSEYDGHCAVVAWLDLLKNQHVNLSYNSPPNECVSRPMLGKAKKMGMRTGWPDLEIYADGSVIFIEFKLADGVLSKKQQEIHREMRKLGYHVYVVRYTTTNQAVEKVSEILQEHGIKEAKI